MNSHRNFDNRPFQQFNPPGGMVFSPFSKRLGSNGSLGPIPRHSIPYPGVPQVITNTSSPFRGEPKYLHPSLINQSPSMHQIHPHAIPFHMISPAHTNSINRDQGRQTGSKPSSPVITNPSPKTPTDSIKVNAQTNQKLLSSIDSLDNLINKYRDTLMLDVVPFWVKNSKDEECGGYFTCLDDKGEVFDTDKFIWLQGREVWMFSKLYAQVEPKEVFLEMALHGAEFIDEHGRDQNTGDWYFSLNREGEPLVQPYNIFSDCFACMAFAGLDRIAPNDHFKTIASSTFQNILNRKDDWKGQWGQNFPGTRPLRNFSLPMILCNLAIECQHIIGTEELNSMAPELIDDILLNFYDPQYGLIRENIHTDGSFVDSFEGRLLNPGHAIEAMWFIMDLCKRFQMEDKIIKAQDIILSTLEKGWDQQFGGIFYFLDIKGHPTQQLQWDQKLWWVHVEALVALAKAYYYTGDEKCNQWFGKVHNYFWRHFKDPNNPEFWGYLNRRGETLLHLKGGKWKGFFHIPRSFLYVWKTLEQILSKQCERQPPIIYASSQKGSEDLTDPNDLIKRKDILPIIQPAEEIANQFSQSLDSFIVLQKQVSTNPNQNEPDEDSKGDIEEMKELEVDQVIEQVVSSPAGQSGLDNTQNPQRLSSKQLNGIDVPIYHSKPNSPSPISQRIQTNETANIQNDTLEMEFLNEGKQSVDPNTVSDNEKLTQKLKEQINNLEKLQNSIPKPIVPTPLEQSGSQISPPKLSPENQRTSSVQNLSPIFYLKKVQTGDPRVSPPTYIQVRMDNNGYIGSSPNQPNNISVQAVPSKQEFSNTKPRQPENTQSNNPIQVPTLDSTNIGKARQQQVLNTPYSPNSNYQVWNQHGNFVTSPGNNNPFMKSSQGATSPVQNLAPNSTKNQIDNYRPNFNIKQQGSTGSVPQVPFFAPNSINRAQSPVAESFRGNTQGINRPFLNDPNNSSNSKNNIINNKSFQNQSKGPLNMLSPQSQPNTNNHSFSGSFKQPQTFHPQQQQPQQQQQSHPTPQSNQFHPPQYAPMSFNNQNQRLSHPYIPYK